MASRYLTKKITCSFSANGNLLKTALYNFHKEKLNAKFVGFAGYDMPVQYPTGVLQEHLHTREKCGIFDVSHMGQVKYEFIEKIVVGNIVGLNENTSTLSLILNENAGIIDDTIVSNYGDHLNMVLNAGNKFQDLKHIEKVKEEHFKNKDIQINYLEDRSLIAVQGPMAAKIIQENIDEDLKKVGFMSSFNSVFKKINANVCISRTGYTGEDGFEISVLDKDVEKFMEVLLANENAKPIGLGARDSLRLEAGLCLHGKKFNFYLKGNDIDENTNPAEAVLMWTVRKKHTLNKFIGSEALDTHRKNIKRKRVGFTVEGQGIIRGGSEIVNSDGEKIGLVTSGSFSPVLKKGIGMAYTGTYLTSKVRGKELKIILTKMPFVPAKYYKI